MNYNRLKTRVLELLSTNSTWYGMSLEHIVFTIHNILKRQNGENVTKGEIERVLSDMSNAGYIQLVGSKKKGYNIMPATNIKTGTLYSNSGELIIDGTGKKVVIPYHNRRFLDSGVYSVQFKEDPSGQIIITSFSRIKDKTSAGIPVDSEVRIKGYVLKGDDGRFVFYADDKKKYPNGFTITSNNSGTAELNGQISVAVLNEFDLNKATVSIQQTFGPVGDPVDEVKAFAAEAGVRYPINPEAEKQANAIETQVDLTRYNLVDEHGNPVGPQKSGKPVYLDFRDKQFRTIDPFDCRDMDDAVYTEIDTDGNLVTYSAIADVTEYITPASPIWNEAMRQAFTLYTPYKAFAMIPEILATGILSLKPGEDRLTICTISTIDKNTGKRIPGKDRVVHAVIKSKGKHSYEEVQGKLDSYNETEVMARIMERVKNGGSHEPQTEEEALILTKVCADKLWKAFRSREVLTINRDDEKRFVLDDSKTEVLDIEPKKHIPSMSIIEALMINSNEVTGEYIRDLKLNGVFRIHDSANEEKLEKFRAMMAALGLEYSGDGSNISLQKFMDAHKDSPYINTIKEMVLRTQTKAKYSKNPFPTDLDGNDKTGAKCHSALQSDCYAHFTAGIRRFSDLIVQYAIKTHLRTGKQAFSEEYVAQVAALISSMELKIEEAEKRISDLYCAIWAEKHVGEIHEGKIVAFNGPYAIVEDPEKGYKVHVRIDELCPGGKLDEQCVSIRDEKGNMLFKLCDNVTFKIDKTSRVDRMIYATVAQTKKLNPVQEIIAKIKRSRGGKVSEAELAEIMKNESEETVSALVQEMQKWKQGVDQASPAPTIPPTSFTPDNGGKGKK